MYSLKQAELSTNRTGTFPFFHFLKQFKIFSFKVPGSKQIGLVWLQSKMQQLSSQFVGKFARL